MKQPTLKQFEKVVNQVYSDKLLRPMEGTYDRNGWGCAVGAYNRAVGKKTSNLKFEGAVTDEVVPLGAEAPKALEAITNDRI